MAALFLDHRTDLQGRPGAHALIVGVSEYPKLSGKAAEEFGALSWSAFSAYSIAKWFKESFAHPTAGACTCRLLVAPSTTELEAHRELKDWIVPCGVDDFTIAASAWRKDGATHKDNICFFYFAGHGLELGPDLAVLFDDFGSGIGPTLRSAVGIKNIVYGMAPSRFGDIARLQLYFLDCSRTKSGLYKQFEYQNSTNVFDVDLSVFDDRCAPVFYASASGGKTVEAKSGRTLFNEALLKCLQGYAGAAKTVDDKGRELPPHVSVFSLIHGLKSALAAQSKEAKVAQEFTVSGMVRDAMINQLEHWPEIDVQLSIEPPIAISLAQVKISDANGAVVSQLPMPLSPNPYVLKLRPGLYSISAKVDPPHEGLSDRSSIIHVEVSGTNHVIRLAKE